MSKPYTIIATTAMGLESITADECRKLGYEDLQVENGKVTMKADPIDICRTNLWLRTADRIKLKIGEFEALTFDSLFEQTKALPWADFLPEDAEFPVIGKSIKSTLYSVPDCQAIVKKAVVESMKQHHNVEWFSEEGAMHKIEIALHKDMATITLDTSGYGLHKRGYRYLHGQAPLKETLAAAMIYLTKWTPDRPFVDPFCGSGTLPIEAAMIGQNIAPGFNREFVSEDWPMIVPAEDWEKARQEVEDLANYDQPIDIMGSDIDHKLVELSQNNAKEAGFGELITFKQMQASDFTTKALNGVMVGNPPYGERMGEEDSIQALSAQLGELSDKYPSWSFYFITSYEAFESYFGKKATKKRKLYNGRIRTDYYQYFGKKNFS